MELPITEAVLGDKICTLELKNPAEKFRLKNLWHYWKCEGPSDNTGELEKYLKMTE